MNSYSVYLLSLQTVTMDNAEEYVDLMFDFCMHTGIQKQMEAFRGNFTYGRIYVQLGGLIGAQDVLVSSGSIEWLSKL